MTSDPANPAINIRYGAYDILRGIDLAPNVILFGNPGDSLDTFWSALLPKNTLYIECWDRERLTFIERLITSIFGDDLSIKIANKLHLSPFKWRPPLSSDAFLIARFSLAAEGDIDVFCQYGQSRSRAAAEFLVNQSARCQQVIRLMPTDNRISGNKLLTSLLVNQLKRPWHRRISSVARRSIQPLKSSCLQKDRKKSI